MATVLVIFRQDVEEKWFDIVVECFMIEKQLGQKTKILTVDSIDITIDFEDGKIVFMVDFISRWMKCRAFLSMSIVDLFTFHVLQTEFTDE